MATAAVTYTFTASTTAAADEVNSNFADLVAFLNTTAVHTDGSQAMTGALDAGSNKIINLSTPTAATDAANKTYADSLVGTGAIATASLADGAVTTAKLADNSVTSAKIVAGTIATSDIADDAITTAKIATGAVTADSIASGAVDTAELASDAVTTAKIASGAVDTTELADDAVTNGKTDVGSWTSLSLSNSWVTFTGRQATQYRKRFDEVQVRGDIRNGTATNGTLVFTLPSGHRPPADISVPVTAAVISTSAGQPRFFIDASTGQVQCFGMDAVGANADVSFMFSFSTSS